MALNVLSKPFDPATQPKDSSRLAFGRAVVDLGGQVPNMVFLTADGALPTGTADFFKKYPERAFNVGIAEQNLIGIAAGMATAGLLPVVGGYGPFLSGRAWEQIRNDLAYTKLHAVIGGVYTGISMATGGSTHHTTEDLASLRAVANMTVITPADGKEAYKATVAATTKWHGPVYIRLAGRSPEFALYGDLDYGFEIGKAVSLREGTDATIIACGAQATYSVIASDMLRKEGFKVAVLNMHTVKPLDEAAILKAARETGRIVTVEEHNILGGLGSAVAECVTNSYPVPVKRLGIKDVFASIGPLVPLQAKYGLTWDGIAASVKEFLTEKKKQAA